MAGMNRAVGTALSGTGHLIQSVIDILTTPIGSRVLNRDYGSRIFEMIGRPLNDETVADIVQSVAEALARWEPRITLTSVRVVPNAASGLAGLVIVTPQAGELEIEL